MARLREDPVILLRKLWPNFNAVWAIKPIEDRFLLRSYYESVPFGLFTAALIFDDALYSVIAIIGLSALILTPWDRRKVLLGGWLLYVMLVMMLTHGEGRYRHFLFPTLLPFAAWFVCSLRTAEWRQVAAWQRWGVVAMVIACLWTPLFLRYPLEWATLNVRRSWLAQRADWAAQAGNFDSALERYFQAAKVDPKSPDIWLAVGKLQLQRGAVEQALSAFDSAFLVTPAYIPVNMHRGDALRRLGRDDEARRAFEGYYTYEDDMLEWSWQFLNAPPTTAIDVGDGLDFGYVHGMYAAEQQVGRSARWTNGRAEVELAGSDAGGTIQLTLAAPRLDVATVDARLCVLSICRDISLGPKWRTYTLIVPKAASYRIELRSPTFQPQRFDPQSPDNRTLGIIVDQVKFEDFAATTQHVGTR
jgi:tetratricopeptide (TPR) repeat protein